MSLYVVAKLYGLEISQALAKDLEYIWCDNPSNDPFAIN